jgi:hypothetical protein
MLLRMELTPARRRVLSTVLAFVLAIESVSAVAAAAQVGANRPGAPVHPPSSEVALAATPAPPRLVPADRLVDPVARVTDPRSEAPAAEAATTLAADPAKVAPTRKAAKGDKHRSGDARSGSGKRDEATSDGRGQDSKPARATSTHRSRSSGQASYSGRNHVWIPSLGINRSIAWFPCSRSREPGNSVYRWGCAGTNNVYLMGHAWGVFEPLHDAYVRGQLRRGMKAVYADANGRVRTYAVRWWKLVKPTTSASWAWASLPSPSMTLQTCVGARSQYRLMVRLGQVGD